MTLLNVGDGVLYYFFIDKLFHKSIKDGNVLRLELLKKVLLEPVKVVYRRMRNTYQDIPYIYQTPRLAKNADINRPAEAAVFIMIAENWNSFESVYRCISADSRINITVYVFPGHVLRILQKN